MLFYCHFPDCLLTPPRHGLYHLYRFPFDLMERLSTRMADRVLVNSRFTAEAFRRVYPGDSRKPRVLYPGVDCERYRDIATTTDNQTRKTMIAVISRFEPNKNLGLAIEAMGILRESLPRPSFGQIELVIAGGYDERLREGQRTLRELDSRARGLDIQKQVVFMRNPRDAERLELLRRCRCVVYTPENEHFGLVPLEAMAAGRPVVAIDSGGPRETIKHEETGMLCAPNPEAIAEALTQIISNPDRAERMGQAARAHVQCCFSRNVFGKGLETILQEMIGGPCE